MRKFYLSIGAILITCLFACSGGKNNPSPSSQSPILGMWNLHQENWVQFVDGVKQVDTTYFASANNSSYAKFNDAGTFSSVSRSVAFITGPNNLGNGSGNVASVDSVSGTYSYTASAFSISSPLAGFNNVTGFFGTSTEVPVFKPVSQSTQIKQLTALKLDMHLEYVYMVSTSAGTKTYKNEQDLYYIK